MTNGQSPLFLYETHKIIRLASSSFNIDSAIKTLKSHSLDNNLDNVRICFHEADSSRVHYMLIYHSSSYKVPVHKHPSKSEFLHVLEGSCQYSEYQLENSEIQKVYSLHMMPGDTIFIKQDIWHSLEIYDDLVFTEITQGPFSQSSTEFLETNFQSGLSQ